MIRVIVALSLAGLFFCILWFSSAALFTATALIVVGWGLIEISRMFLPNRFERNVTISVGILVFISGRAHPEDLIFLLPLTIFLLALLFMWRNDQLSGIAERLGISSLSLIYLSVSFLSWTVLREMGREWVLLIIVPACLTDSFGLFIGKTIGKRPLAPMVSPKKTWEGFWGALLGSLIGIFSIWPLFFRESMPIHHAFGFAILIWITAPLGDLIESMLKRSAGVKDSGTIIPGHGGILDRLDALIFSGPAACLYVKYLITL